MSIGAITWRKRELDAATVPGACRIYVDSDRAIGQEAGDWCWVLPGTNNDGTRCANCRRCGGICPDAPREAQTRSLNRMDRCLGPGGGRCVYRIAQNKSWAGSCSLAVQLNTSAELEAVALFYSDDMKTLPDHLRKGMKTRIIGCNPTESSVRTGHYYSGRGNHLAGAFRYRRKFPSRWIPRRQTNHRILRWADGSGETPDANHRGTDAGRLAEGRIVLSQKLGEYLRCDRV